MLRAFLGHRAEAVDNIQGVLNAQRKPPQYLRDASMLARLLDECFFTLPGPGDRWALARQLDEAHWASGFKPRHTPGEHNDLIDPAEMMTRGFHLWQQTRWPGSAGRARWAETLFNLYLLRRLMLLCMRIWDAGAAEAGTRLAQIQGVLDELWRTAPADQPVFVRDARWLFPLAQSPTTDELGGYFVVAQHIADSLSYEHRLEIDKASVRMAGGHLTSQLRHVSTQKGVSIHDHALILITRRSNALDLATLLQGLVPLLEAYERAAAGGDSDKRLELAGAICQGISPDPELFVNRLDLLGPYGMSEYLFIAADRDGHAAYTPLGRRHLQLLEEYAARLARVVEPLHADCARFKPVSGAYSPYGTLYGFSSRLLEHMALKSLAPDAATGFSLEDVFSDGGADKLAWVSGWRKLPHIPRDVQKLFDYPQEFAEQIFGRIEAALRKRVAGGGASAAARAGRLLLVAEDEPVSGSQHSSIPDLAPRFFLSSDRRLVDDGKAEPYGQRELLHSRTEGEFIVSYATPGGWLAITKDALTDVIGAGLEAKVRLPRAAAETLRSMCLGLAEFPETSAQSQEVGQPV